MDSEDGRVFIKNLAYYVRTHEKALANALQQQRPQPTRANTANSSGSRPPTTSSVSSIASQRSAAAAPSTSAFPSFSLPYFGLASQNVRPAKLYLTANQLYYLLSRFEELGVSVGPTNVRLESIHADSTSMNYVSFLNQTKRPKGRSSDQDSLHSVSSVRSVMSSMSAVLSSFNLSSTSTAKIEKRRAAELEDIKYLYSAFTKIPCLKLVFDHRIRRITGFEEFPFDTAVPVFVFKNLTVLEVVDQDFRSFFGWDRLAEQLRSLTVKRAELDDLYDLLTNIVLDDADKRRRRSTKNQGSPTLPYSTPSPALRQAELPRRFSVAGSSPVTSQSASNDGSNGAEALSSSAASQSRLQSVSPSRPTTSGRLGSTKKQRRLSSSSTSSNPSYTPRNSSSNLISTISGGLPSNKWRFLRHLCLADNGLTSISSQSLLPLVTSLTSLDLSSNLFTEIPDSLSTLVSLRALNLSNCMIESLHTLTKNPLPAITVINLKSNRISSIAGIEKLLSLERVDLRGNNLKDPTEIARLTGMPNFRDVYVAKNPFTKTHNNFRIIIFNLFRQSPGYTEDVTVDSAGPGFSERRQLAERVAESDGVPVVQPPLEDDEAVLPEARDSTKPANGDIAVAPQERSERPKTPEDDKRSIPSRRRKGPKRRVVDMAQDTSPRSPGSGRSQDVSPEATFVTATQSPGSPPTHRRRATEGSSVKLVGGEYSDRNESSNPQTSPLVTDQRQTGDHERGMSQDRILNPNSSGEQYRKRIEALKKEYGSSWLHVLNDDKWNETTAVSYQAQEVGQNARQPLAKT